MKKNKSFLGLVFILMIITIRLNAQNSYVLSGKVTDHAGGKIATGSVSLLGMKDAALVKLVQLNDGSFSCGPVKAGNYILKISSLGFDEKQLLLKHQEVEDLIITLDENTSSLREVQVTASKKVFSNHNGNIKIAVENSILSSIPNAADLLAKLPAVQLSSDKQKITVVGKGEPLIYLDNQRIKMEDLLSMSVNDIKAVELINNPSAKFEAEGRAVIMITRKTERANGTKIDFTEAASFKKSFQNRAGLNINVKKNKFEFRGNIQYNYLNLWESNGNDFQVTNKDLVSDYVVTSIGLRTQTVAGAGLYYQINENDYLSINTSKRFQQEDFTIATNSFLKKPPLTENVITQNYNGGSRPFFNSSLNYNKKFKESNAQLFAGGQYSQFSQNLNSNIWNNYNNTETVLSQDRQQKYLIDVLTARVDFEQSFKNGIKWESGTNVSGAHSNSILNIENYSPVSNTGSSYDYSEKIYAAYTQISGKIGKVEYAAGLRVENTKVMAGYTDSTALSVNTNYTKLFPKASLNVPVAEKTTLTFGYSKSIIRPNYSTASQVTTYINPFFEWGNNININPSISQEFSATVQYKESSWGASYYRINNPVYYSAAYDDQLNRLKMTDRNYTLESGINVNITVPVKYGFWTATNTLIATKDQIKDAAAVTGKSSPYLYLYSNNQFNLPAGYSFMISGWGITKRNEGVFERNAMIAVDTAITKTFNKKLTCTLGYNSIISTGQAKENFNINEVSSRGVYYLNNREFSMSVKYAFGKLKDPKYKNKDSNDNMSRIR